MKKSIETALNGGYWLIYLLFFGFIYFIANASGDGFLTEDFLMTLLISLLTSAASFYSFYGVLVPRYLSRRKVAFFSAFGIVVCLSVAALTAFLLACLVFALTTIFPEPVVLLNLTAGFGLLALLNGAFGTILKGFIRWYSDIHAKEILHRKNLESELALVKSQINPHFLFNTLSNIDILIEKDPKTASNYLNSLSDIMRFTLYEASSDRILLARELEYIGKYIELQKIRTSNQQFITYQLTGQPNQLTIAPLTLISFIENAFKHCRSKNRTTPSAL